MEDHTSLQQLSSIDREIVLNELYRLSRLENQTSLERAVEEKVAELIYSTDDEIVWRSILLLGIYYPSRILYKSILIGIKSNCLMYEESYIASAILDAVAKLIERGLVYRQEFKNNSKLFSMLASRIPIHLVLFLKYVDKDISYDEYVLNSVHI